MKKALFAGLCALAILGCEASEESANNDASQSAPTAAQQTTATAMSGNMLATPRVGGVPTNMLVSGTRPLAQGAILSEMDLQQLLVGNSIKQVDDQYWAYFGQGGQLRGLLVNLTETGAYSLSGGTVCKSWPTWATGTQLCYRVLNLGNARYRFSGINVDSFDVVISRGNPQGL
ncbi:MAG: hypothetical protein ACPG40_00215 [Alphaproteobacteria bacterium]